MAPVLHRAPALAVLDGVSEAMVLHGLELERNSDAAAFIAMLPRRLAGTGASTVWIDHVVKDRMSRGRYSIGAQHKLAGLDGAAYHFEPVAPFGRGLDGAATITVAKDRSGFVRAFALNRKIVGPFRLQASRTPMRAEIGAPEPGWDPETGLSITQTRVLAALPAPDGSPLDLRAIGDVVASDGSANRSSRPRSTTRSRNSSRGRWLMPTSPGTACRTDGGGRREGACHAVSHVLDAARVLGFSLRGGAARASCGGGPRARPGGRSRAGAPRRR